MRESGKRRRKARERERERERERPERPDRLVGVDDWGNKFLPPSRWWSVSV